MRKALILLIIFLLVTNVTLAKEYLKVTDEEMKFKKKFKETLIN